MVFPPSVKVLRRSAFKKQKGRCYYCGSPIWEKDKESFAEKNSIPLDQALKLQCTAEHLRARCDGGKNWPKNIVAACISCNAGRHQGRKVAPSPKEYKEIIRKQRSESRQANKSL